AVGPRFAPVREAILAGTAEPSRNAAVIAAASPIGADGAVVRVAAERMEGALRALRPSLVALAGVLGDDPFARKW
ncbi:MAG: urease accessory protein UreD, partial [Polyangiaceae bacterium]